jgi:hypothetical protein
MLQVLNSLKPEAALNDMGTYASLPHDDDHLPSSSIGEAFLKKT